MSLPFLPLGIGLLVWFVYARGRPGSPYDGQESPLDILQRRYALGEIDRDEFLRRKETLQG
ncbi:MAG TPA: SHOCT domain-containing protein [Anaerolineae bacterium]|nr:SHOCT domain-containing protein [Anaerolineae bacterium]